MSCPQEIERGLEHRKSRPVGACQPWLLLSPYCESHVHTAYSPLRPATLYCHVTTLECRIHVDDILRYSGGVRFEVMEDKEKWGLVVVVWRPLGRRRNSVLLPVGAWKRPGRSTRGTWYYGPRALPTDSIRASTFLELGKPEEVSLLATSLCAF